VRARSAQGDGYREKGRIGQVRVARRFLISM
jgi:hypothetical protein